ncbi:MAG: hypothetical protein AB8G99_06675 [Planctomycetaceae bacterium]
MPNTIDHVPKDPFGTDIQYDSTRSVAWSIGPNRRNDNGLRTEGDEDDRVRRIGIPTDGTFRGQ